MRFGRHAPACCFCLAFVLLGSQQNFAQEVTSFQMEGYTEPSKVIQVAADETGTVAEVLVREGDVVRAGDPLLRLNSELIDAQIELASQQMTATGRLRAAKAEAELTAQRLEKLQLLKASGHARQTEISRATKEAEVAAANLMSVQEDAETMRLEYESLVTRRARRTVRAPIDGFVTEVHRNIGEFVAPNRPEVLTLVKLDLLHAKFAVGEQQARRLEVGNDAEIELIDDNAMLTGKVKYVSPVTDAESGTVVIKVELENAKRKFRGGSRCRLISVE
ncbi:MAG: efflux RND transporter periplasmic adaptor subunit [Planctomycetota bacterium]